MSTESPRVITEKRLQNVLREIRAIAGGHFPHLKLENRLLNLGLEEFVDESILQTQGFPFKFNSQLDEAILVLAHFLERFKDERGSLKIYSLNKLAKGQDRDLSYWHDAKAKLYLELQNIILLLNNVDGRESKVSRIFTFGDLSDLAFLTQAGLNVLSEQLAINIDIGFMFLNDFEKRREIAPISNTLIIDFTPGKVTDRKHNGYELYGMTDESARNDLPYQERCTSKWYKQLDDEALLRSKKRLKELLQLHNWKDKDEMKWKPLSLENSKYICKFEQQGERKVFFNDATLMMYNSFARSPILEKYPGKEEFIINRINGTVITRDMIRLQRAMSSFDDPDHPDSLEVKAVDATSVKNSLQLHESRPTYRDWLRRSLNRVLNTRHKKLSRIYILKDQGEEGKAEFQTFLRIMQYYLDYFHYEIPEMTAIVHRPNKKLSSKDNFTDQTWFKDQWKSFPQRVSVRITTNSILSDFSDRVLSSDSYPGTFDQIFEEPAPTKHENLANLDYLTTDHMIYNFLNPRADTDELQFPAYLYRNELNIKKERDTLFYLKTDDRDFKKFQIQHRINLLADSIVEYKSKYLGSAAVMESIEENFRKSVALMKGDKGLGSATDLETVEVKIGKIIEKREKGDDYGVTMKDQTTLVAIRAAFETALFGHFKRHFDYLYEVLEFQSMEISFWDDVKLLSIEEIEPFKDGGNDISGLREKIRDEVEKNLKTKTLPALGPTASGNKPGDPLTELVKKFK